MWCAAYCNLREHWVVRSYYARSDESYSTVQCTVYIRGLGFYVSPNIFGSIGLDVADVKNFYDPR